MKKLSRREFISQVAVPRASLAIPIFAGGMLSSCSVFWKGYGALGNWASARVKAPEGRTPLEPVVNDIRSQLTLVNSGNAVSGDGRVDPAIVRTMVREGIKAIGGTSQVEDGWRKVFPSYTSGETVGIKVNVCQRTRTRGEVVGALVDELSELGIPPANIIIWDNLSYASYGWKKMGYQGVAERGVKLRTTLDPGAGYDEEQFAEVPSVDLRLPLSRILTTDCDYLINMPVIKSNSVCGITGALKNYFGTVALEDAVFHKWTSAWSFYRNIVGKIHLNNCCPQIAEVASNALIRKKTRLHVGDALLSMYEGGPFGNPQWINGQLLMSQDPVALDYYGFQIIERKRQEKGLKSAGLRAKYIQSAAEMGLGTNNPAQIEQREVSLR